MEQRGNYAAVKGVQIKSSMEEYAEGDAKTKLREITCV